MSQTFIFLKPDALERKLTGNILKMIEDAGFKRVQKKEVFISEPLILTHYQEVILRLNSKAFVQMVLNEFVGKTVECYIFETENYAPKKMRALVGATNPALANIHSIRGKYAQDSYEQAQAENRVIRNLIHASEDDAYAQKEIALWFEGKGIIESFDFESLEN
jgi:nucleoside-diphosphate kinase